MSPVASLAAGCPRFGAAVTVRCSKPHTFLQRARFRLHSQWHVDSLANLGSRETLAESQRPKEFIPAFWTCVFGRYVPCPLAPIRNDQARWATHLAHVDALLPPRFFVSTGSLVREVPPSVASADLNSMLTGAQQDMMEALRSELANIRSPDPKQLALMEEFSKAVQGNMENNQASQLMLDPLEARERVLRGIRNNDLYILSHPEYEQASRDRNEGAVRFDTEDRDSSNGSPRSVRADSAQSDLLQ